MSRTYSLVCLEAKLSLWVGQGPTSREGMTVIYAMPEHTERLRRFLIATAGKPLVFMDDEHLAVHYDGVEEFEDPDAE